MSEVQTPGAEAEVPATVAVEAPVAAPVAAVVEPVAVEPVPAVAASVADIVKLAAESQNVPAPAADEAPTIAKSELAHVFEAFEHFSLMEGISRLYALAKKHL